MTTQASRVKFGNFEYANLHLFTDIQPFEIIKIVSQITCLRILTTKANNMKTFSTLNEIKSYGFISIPDWAN